MAAPWAPKILWSCFNSPLLARQIRCSLPLYNQLSLSIRTYSTNKSRMKARRKSPVDPRYRVQYPYVPGDPVQETEVRKAKKGRPSAIETSQNNHKASDHIRSNMTAQASTDSGLMYTRLKDGDIRFGRTILAVRSKANSSHNILLEGQRLIRDSMLLGAELKTLYFSDEKLLQDLPFHLLKEVELFKVLYRDLKTWTDTTTPSGIMGIFKKPRQGEISHPRETILPITLILDGVTDPGNAGTLIRTAAAVGCDRILAVKGCVSLWAGKVLRSGMGGHFAIPIYSGLNWSQVYNYVGNKAQVFLAEPKPLEVDGSTHRASDNYSKIQEKLDAHEEFEKDGIGSDSESSSSDDDDDNSFLRQRREQELKLFHAVPFPLSSYSDIQLQVPETSNGDSRHHISLVLGGETKGLSACAKKFAYDYYGQTVTLPMSNDIDSLNTAVAGGIILYEIRRKLLKD